MAMQTFHYSVKTFYPHALSLLLALSSHNDTWRLFGLAGMLTFSM